jgi:hypothetical protein
MAVSLSAFLALFPQQDPLVAIFVKGFAHSGAIARLEGLSQLISSVTSSGIEPATFLNHLPYLRPRLHGKMILKLMLLKYVLVD